LTCHIFNAINTVLT